MTLEELLKLLPQEESVPIRNSDTQPGVYVPNKTDFQFYYLPKSGADGLVHPFMSNTAWINNGDMDNDLEPDLIRKRYTAFHEAAHTAQSPVDMYLGLAGLGSTRKLDGNTFKSYSYDDKSVDPLEALATMRGVEAMMPTGSTIWDMKKKYPKDSVANDVEKYLQQTMKTTGMSRAGAKRYLDIKMFPEHSLMHEPDSFVPAKGPPSTLQQILDALQQALRK